MGSRRKPGDVTDVTPEVTTKFLGAVIGGSPYVMTDTAAPTVSSWLVRRLGLGANIFHGRYSLVDIAELLMWDRLLTDTERQKVERHLGAFWGIAVS